MKIATYMEQPSWSKLSEKLLALHEKPWQFGLFRAINVLETEWAEAGELASGLSSRVFITPNKELGFPASEVKKANIVASHRGTIHLEVSYSGLYGADAAMPHYVLEQAAQDDVNGARTRAFLDIFNHQYYCLLYQAWKKSQLNIQGVGAEQYDGLLDAILSSSDINNEREVNTGVAGLKTTSASGLAKLLNDEFALSQITVDDASAHWQSIGQVSALGSANNSVLGESLILGDQVLVAGGKVIIDLGELAANEGTAFFPGQTQGDKLCQLLKKQLPVDLPWQCRVSVRHSEKKIQTIGEANIVLGIDSHIGNVTPKVTRQEFKDSQYKNRLSLARSA
ncbi:type VI secretion system baseplate subunit TssG [Thalassotalea euphylliae]|uniref:Type VI secretion system baseplate subunit TssG n=1 Tax=Thalassotalea euphylliae TaxID=1655234 RepID=A0A3E0TQ39_9GAMM|nr:type VI secretion system baseplate subunit TssG [Thalassotalea euphylliae]REL26644.1 type VI secretion system baseplate subunit TssG [Thalassotalea euphylliae]